MSHPSRQTLGIVCDDAQVANTTAAHQLKGVADRLYSALSAAMVQPAAGDVVKATLDGSAWVWCVRVSHLRLLAHMATSYFKSLCSMGSQNIHRARHLHFATLLQGGKWVHSGSGGSPAGHCRPGCAAAHGAC